jgi:RNA polymerase sigma-70 factor (ECF subfamily)
MPLATASTLTPGSDAKTDSPSKAVSPAAYDAELVRRCQQGDESAFNEIVARHRDRVFTVALQTLHNRADAEEIAQDTFVRAYRGIAKFRGDSSLATWLHRIALNLARNRYWYFHRRARYSTLSLECPLSAESDGTFSDLIPSPAAGPSREAIAKEFSDLVTESMERLTPGQREILGLRNILNKSYDEIAATLGIEVGTVKSRIARARGQLRAIMVETCPEFDPESASSEWFEPSRPAPGNMVHAA